MLKDVNIEIRGKKMGLLSSLGSLAGAAVGSLFGPSGAAIGYGLGESLGSNADSNRAFNKQKDLNWQMWDAENKYNHPTQQMARLREAGLNPNLVYGSGATTLSASTKSAPVYQQPQLDAIGVLNAYQDLAQKDAMTENIKAQKALIDAQVRQADANARIADKDAKLYDQTGVNPQRPVSQNVFSNVSHYVRRAGEYVGDKVGDWWYSLPEGNYNGGKLY